MARQSKTGGKKRKATARKTTKTLRRIDLAATPRRRRSVVDLTKARDEALAREAATAEILASISQSTTDPRPVFRAILRNLFRSFGTRFAVVVLLRDSMLELVGIEGEPGFEKMARGYPRPLDYTTFVGKVMLAGRAMQVVPVVGNPAATIASEQWGREFGFNALISVPLIREGKVIGGISTAHRDPKRFNEAQVALIKSFADQAVIAIENARLLNETKEALERQTATSEVLQIISRSAFDLDSVLRTLVETAAKLCRAVPSQIYQREGEVYRSAAIRGEFSEAYRAIEESSVISAGRGTLIGRVALGRGLSKLRTLGTILSTKPRKMPEPEMCVRCSVFRFFAMAN